MFCSTLLDYMSSDIYYLAFPNDRRLHKWLVYSVYFLETVDTVFLTYDALADFRNVFGLSVPVSSRNTSSPVQFSWLRMYIFGGIGAFHFFVFGDGSFIHCPVPPISDLHCSVLLRLPSPLPSAFEDFHLRHTIGTSNLGSILISFCLHFQS